MKPTQLPFDIVDDCSNDRVVIFHHEEGYAQRFELSNCEAMELAEQLFRVLRKPRTDYVRRGA